MGERAIVRPGTVQLRYGQDDARAIAEITHSLRGRSFNVTLYNAEATPRRRRIVRRLVERGTVVVTSGNNAQFTIDVNNMIEATLSLLDMDRSVSTPDRITFSYFQRAANPEDTTYNEFAGEPDRDTIDITPTGRFLPGLGDSFKITHGFLNFGESGQQYIPATVTRMMATGLCVSVEWVRRPNKPSHIRVVLTAQAMTDYPSTFMMLAEQFPLRTGVY